MAKTKSADTTPTAKTRDPEVKAIYEEAKQNVAAIKYRKRLEKLVEHMTLDQFRAALKIIGDRQAALKCTPSKTDANFHP